MNTREVFEKIDSVEEELDELQKKLEQKEEEFSEAMDSCGHEIVFKYKDDHPRLLNMEGCYYCPACCKTVMCHGKYKLKDSVFKNSRVISLTNLSLIVTKEVSDIIRSEVLDNYELYYNPNTPIEELTTRMEELLKDEQYVYEEPGMVLKRHRIRDI